MKNWDEICKSNIVIKEMTQLDIPNGYILIPGSEEIGLSNTVYLAEEAGIIWRMIAEGKRAEEIVQAEEEQFDEDPAILREDLMEFLDELERAKVISLESAE